MSTTLLQSVETYLRRLFRQPDPRILVDRTAFERLVGQPIHNLALYERAMRHRSLLRSTPDSALTSNERLEFLGDAVLGFVTAEHLYTHFPDKDEGYLTRLRAKLVNGQALARSAERIDLGRLILMSENMAQDEGRRNQTILADAFEALIGAIYLDLGIKVARGFIARTILEHVDLKELAQKRDNFKSLLLEYAQAHGWPQPRYRIVAEEGPSHAKMFTVEAMVRNESVGRGTARSKKKAEQRAAHEALDHFRRSEAGNSLL